MQFSYSLTTDLYQLTMAQGYWKLGMQNKKAVFHLSFRKHPFFNGYIVFCGLQDFLEIVEKYRFDSSDLDYLATLKTSGGQALFSPDFLKFLKNFSFRCRILSFLEGSITFASEPTMRIEGNLLECQLLESILLNIINFQSLIATKSSRIYNVAKNKPILEFGLRRAQGIDGALSASRAAYIGGCSSTSNVVAGKIHRIPVVGTHSHSWVKSFSSEKEAFQQYVLSSPQNCSFLIDTYSILEGIENAISVVKKYLPKKENFFAVRIDSGDLAYFSQKVRQRLDEEGFTKTKIIASNDLDEHIIASLHEQGAKIDIWAVGTKLVTAHTDSALGGVYKLSAILEKKWRYCIKLSEDIEKVNNPGVLQVARFFDNNGSMQADVIYDELTEEKTMQKKSVTMLNPSNPLQKKKLLRENYELLLKEVMLDGKIVYSFPSIHQVREHTLSQLQKLDSSLKRLIHPHIYPVGLEQNLFSLKKKLISKTKK